MLRRDTTSPHLVFAAHSSFFFRASSAFCSGEPFLSRGDAAAEADAADAAVGGRGWLLDGAWAASAAARADARVLRPPFLLPPTTKTVGSGERGGGVEMLQKSCDTRNVAKPRKFLEEGWLLGVLLPKVGKILEAALCMGGVNLSAFVKKWSDPRAAGLSSSENPIVRDLIPHEASKLPFRFPLHSQQLTLLGTSQEPHPQSSTSRKQARSRKIDHL